eukprot:1458750-Rhodomonas_salina.4
MLLRHVTQGQSRTRGGWPRQGAGRGGIRREVAAGGLLERDVLVEGRAVADADVRREERGVAVLELVAERAVDGVGVEVTAPEEEEGCQVTSGSFYGDE